MNTRPPPWNSSSGAEPTFRHTCLAGSRVRSTTLRLPFPQISRPRTIRDRYAGFLAEVGDAEDGVETAVGRTWEDLACAELERQGMQVLERNWRCQLGEIDIVAAETGDNGLTGLL